MNYEIDVAVPAGSGWAGVVRRGQRFRIGGLQGEQSIDTTFYNAENPADRHSPVETLSPQKRSISTSELLTEQGTVLMRVVPPSSKEKHQCVELVAETDTLVVMSNSSRFDLGNEKANPSPVRVLLWSPD